MRYRVGTFLVTLLAVACGGGSPTNPTPPPGGGGGGGGGGGPVATTTINITSSGVSPKIITVARGSRVTFVNGDVVQHEMNSDPHPFHGDCPEIDQVGFLSAGQQKQTGNLNTARTCGYHDHNRDTDTSLQGQIIVQ